MALQGIFSMNTGYRIRIGIEFYAASSSWHLRGKKMLLDEVEKWASGIESIVAHTK